MKNAFYAQYRTRLKNTMIFRLLAIVMLFILSAQFHLLHAQGPKLSVQGILKKSSGEAVPDGTYNLTFKLYTVASGGSAIWTEMQNDVDVVSGIYSTVLGNGTPLNIAFNQVYYLGVTVGSTEMTPRVQLTSAPYALALIGTTNQFPSSGIVVADSVRVNGGVLARGGAPGANGANKNGFAFTTNNGDKDSGLFSLGNGQVSVYVNNAEQMKATPDSVVIKQDLRLAKGSKIDYNGQDDWRLVYDDDLSGGASNWKVYNPLSGEKFGWNNTTDAGASPLSGDATKFIGRYLYPASNDQVLKKFYDLTNVGSYSYIKVKFKYYFIDSWNGPSYDESNNDAGFAAFAESAAGDQFRMGWYQTTASFQNYNQRMTTPPTFINANKWEGNSTNPEFFQNAEMTANKNAGSNGFWLMFGSSLNNTHTDESFGVGMIEIWVK